MPYYYEDDAAADFFSRYDYNREAYGDPCPGCGTLRWQADCPKCFSEAEELAEDCAALKAEEPAPKPAAPEAEDGDIIF